MMSKSEKTKPYKILYLDFVSAIGGGQVSLLLLLKSLNAKKFKPLVILPGKGPLFKKIQTLGIEIKILPMNKINIINPLPYIKTVWDLVRILRHHKIDLLHCNSDICNQYGVIAAKLVGVHVVTHTRNILGKRAFQRMFLGKADVLIANSRACAYSYSQYISKSQRVETIYNAVDTKQFRPEGRCDLKSRFNTGNGEFVIGQIAQITPNKGQDVFIKALPQVIRAHPNVRALIVGNTVIDNSDWFLDKLKQLVKKLDLVDKVTFTGFIEDIVDMYRYLNLLVLPSRSESFGRTIADAMAMSKPVVATRVGGLPEIISEGETGLLVPSGDSTALANAILEIIENPKLYKKFSNNGRKRVKELFTVEKNVRETERVYISLLTKL